MLRFPAPSAPPIVPTIPSTAPRTAFWAAAASDRIFRSIVPRVELRKLTVSSAAPITDCRLPRTAKVKRQRYVSSSEHVYLYVEPLYAFTINSTSSSTPASMSVVLVRVRNSGGTMLRCAESGDGRFYSLCCHRVHSAGHIVW